MNFIRSTFVFVFVALNCGVGLALLLGAFAQYLSPVVFPVLSIAGLGFPFFAVANLLFLFFWLVVRPKYALIPVAFFLIGIDAVLTYSPFGSSQEAADGKVIRVLTYNTMGMQSKKDDNGKKVIPSLEFIKRSKADIVCLQEFPYVNQHIVRELRPVYPYVRIVTLKSDTKVACFSKTPILSGKRIDMISPGNGAGLFYVKKDQKKIPVIVAHLESNKLNRNDKKMYESILEDPKHQFTEQGSKHLLSKLASAASLRGPQADIIAKQVETINSPYTIVCGDFNDIPLSYTHRVIADGLQDTYREAAFGPGSTYHAHFMYFRIDHILAGQGYRILNCQIESEIDASDHYPYWCELEF